MFQHLDPARLKIRTMRLKVSDAWNADALELALGAQDFHEAPRFRARLTISVELHDVIKVAWARPLGERSEFFRERLDVVVSQDVDAVVRSVRVRVKNRRANGR